MKTRLLMSFALACTLAAFAPSVSADEGDTTLTIAPSFGISSNEHMRIGGGGSLHLKYGVDERFMVRATGFYDSQFIDVVGVKEWSSFAGALVGAGVNMEVGEGQVIPYVFGDVGVAWIENAEPAVALDLSGEVGFDWLFTSTSSAGLAARATVFVGDLPFDDAWLMSAVFRISFTL
jgi:hypothetical protein